MYFLEYLSDIVQEATGRSQGPWATSPVLGSVIFLVKRDISFSISDIIKFRFFASVNADALAFFSLLRMELNY